MKRILIIALLALSPGSARAQVVIHQAALDQLAGTAPAAPAASPLPRPVIRAVSRRIMHRYVRRRGAMATVAFSTPPPGPAGMAPTRALPAAARLAPAEPPAPSPAPKPAQAPGRPAPADVALGFAPGSADLPANAALLLKPICAGAEPSGTVSVNAAAAGVAGDPSVAMRLSMQRAFAVRDALAGCGISPARIIPRALGAVGAGNPDVTRVTLGTGP